MKKTLAVLIFSIFIPASCFAALSSSIVWELRTTGNDSNGGGFKTGASGTDFSQQNSPQYALTGVTSGGSGSTFLTSSAAANMVGNVAQVVSGTNFTAGFYEITSVSAGVSVTVDRSVCTGVGASGVINIGGALVNPDVNSLLTSVIVAGNKVWIKNGTYVGSADISSVVAGSAVAPISIEGYNTARGDAPPSTNRPTLQRDGFSFQLSGYENISNIIVTTSNATGVRDIGGNCFFFEDKISSSAGGSNSAIQPTSLDCLLLCEVTNPGGRAVGGFGASVSVNGCWIHDSAYGIYNTAAYCVTNTIFSGCSSAAVQPSQGSAFSGCTFYGAETPAGVGINLSDNSADSIIWTNCIFYGLTTAVQNDATRVNFGGYNDFFNNTTNRDHVNAMSGDIAVNPQFVNAPSNNFAVGANVKAAGIPGVFPGALTTSYVDTGAVQEQSSSGGGSYTFTS